MLYYRWRWFVYVIVGNFLKGRPTNKSPVFVYCFMAVIVSNVPPNKVQRSAIKRFRPVIKGTGSIYGEIFIVTPTTNGNANYALLLLTLSEASERRLNYVLFDVFFSREVTRTAVNKLTETKYTSVNKWVGCRAYNTIQGVLWKIHTSISRALSRCFIIL